MSEVHQDTLKVCWGGSNSWLPHIDFGPPPSASERRGGKFGAVVLYKTQNVAPCTPNSYGVIRDKLRMRSPSERRWGDLRYFNDFYLRAKARIWP